MKRYLMWISIPFFFFVSCAPTPNPNAQIQVAVAQTVAAIPTYTPYPTPRIAPTATPMNLSGLFCEYQFCIGHPANLAFYDVIAKQNSNSSAASSASQGWLAFYNLSAVIEVMWQDASGASDATFMLNTIIDSKIDSRSGELKAFQINSLNVDFVPITTTATSSLPYGGAAAWTCGGRAFAWKVYTPQAELAMSLLNEALQKFRCNNQ